MIGIQKNYNIISQVYFTSTKNDLNRPKLVG